MRVLGRPFKQLVLAVLLAAAVILAFLGAGVSRHLRNTANYILAPFGEGGMYVATAFKAHSGKLGQRAISPKEALHLTEINVELMGRLKTVEAELARVIRTQVILRGLYGQIPYGQWELIPAQVIGSGSLPYGEVRALNVGENNRATAGAQVTTRRILTDRSKALPNSLATISSTALVGELTSTGAFTSELRLVTDRGFRTAAKILRMINPDNPRKITVTKGANASERPLRSSDPPLDVWAQGNGRGVLIVRGVNAYDNVLPGDWLVTGGNDSALPGRIRIGKVVEVQDDPQQRGLFVNLRVKPHADLQSLREVFIVLPIGARKKDQEVGR